MNHLYIKVEGGLLSPDFLEIIPDAAGQKPQDFGLRPRDSLVDEVSAIWGDVLTYWNAFQRRKARSQESLTTITREQWLLPLLEALGYSLTYQRSAAELDGRSYPISHRTSSDDTGLPVHLVAYDQALGDRPSSGRGTLSPHALVQDYLNRTDEHLWGIVSNGRILRLLRDSTYFTRPAYIEFDLEQMILGERLDEFFLLYRLVHRTRLLQPDTAPADCLLERYHVAAIEQGGRIRDGLRQAVAEAILTFGNSFLRHPRNDSLRRRLQHGDLTVDGFYQQLLYLIYRLLFLMVAEERNLLAIDGPTSDYFRHYFSVTRLRQLADTPLSAPERFDDLYLGLRALFHAFHDEQMAAQLGVPPLNGELFSSEKAPDLDAAHLNNRDLLHAIRLLSYFTPPDEKVRRRVNYAALDVEELGSVYESLLDEQPVLNGVTGWSGNKATESANITPSPHHPITPSFSFVSGTTRKTTGSYYTPRELVNEVIKSALVPVIEDRLANADKSPISSMQSPQEAALLSLRVCDPACGSGHFLLAAARRLGYELAKVRSGADEPSPDLTREATRDAITHCIYGVDKNPLAVDLCKVALWIEGYSRGKPLTFLDYRVRCGDSLVGVLDLAVLDDGIPDDAYQPVSGDDGQVARSLRDQNKEERGGQTSLFDQLSGAATAPDATAWQRMETMPEETPAQVNAKRAAYQRLQQQGDRLRTAANLWTAAFFSPFTAENRATVPTSNVLRRWRQGQSVSQQVVGTANGLAAENRFFHWRLEFPQVFNGGGFDSIIGNPPWEMVQLDAREFFATRDASISNAGTTAWRNKGIEKLKENDPKLHAEYQLALHLNDSYKNFIHSSGRFPLTSFGRINLMAPFAEHSKAIVHDYGLSGLVLPTGIATNSFTQNFFSDLVDKRQLVQMIGFENEAFIFPAVHHSFKFCIFVISGDKFSARATDFVFFCRYFGDIQQTERHFQLSRDDFLSINPNTKTCPIFRTNADAELTKKIYQNVPVLLNEVTGKDPWFFDNMLMFMMNTDSNLFETEPSSKSLPLYEGKLIHQFDHRYATYEEATQANLNSGILPQIPESYKQNPDHLPQPKYWVEKKHVNRKLETRWKRNWLLGFRDITSSIVERTAIFSLLPRTGVANNTPIVFLEKADATLVSCFLGNMNSMAFDYITRQKISGSHLNFYLLKQLPALEPYRYTKDTCHFIVPRVLELVFTAWDIAPFATDVWQEAGEPLRQALRAQWEANRQATGGHLWPVSGEPWSVNGGQKPPFPPFKWDDERRAHLRAELDAYYARLYGLTRDELRYILDPADIYGPDFPGETFRVLKEKEIKAYGEYRTQRLVLAAWDAQQAAIDSGELVFETNDKVTATTGRSGQGDKVKESHSVTLSPGHLVMKEEPSTLELKSPPPQPQARPKAARQPALDIQPTLVTEFTPPQGGYAQRLKRVMALGQPKTQFELTELIAALGDEDNNIRWLASSALSRLGNMPVVKLLAAYLATNPSPPARAEVVRVLETIAAASEDEQIKSSAQKLLGIEPL